MTESRPHLRIDPYTADKANGSTEVDLMTSAVFSPTLGYLSLSDYRRLAPTTTHHAFVS